LSFDLKRGGIPDSHKSNELAIKFFKEIFDGVSENRNARIPAVRKSEMIGGVGGLQSPTVLRKFRSLKYGPAQDFMG